MQLWAFLVTLALEAPLAAALGVRWGGRQGALRAALAAVAGTTLTHPALWWLQRRLEPSPLLVPSLELAIALVEAVGFVRIGRLSPARALVASLACNALSYFAGRFVLAALLS